ncbi:hypothetical protein [Cupriavidus sp. D39]|uniref:hypothetical protein n=1 Tax=Cupriavidus sp. D39 TaxID=2997877 RepID=UPI00226DBCD4|nr:hypothetical protein [Cupriavidus sp. D39]MCY0853267.1 hypothetical protein [Cupriavidus sp. D39]
MHWIATFNAGHDLARGAPCIPGNISEADSGPSRTIILFRIVVNGRGTYYGFFQHACDAIADALDHGAFSVAVVRA